MQEITEPSTERSTTRASAFQSAWKPSCAQQNSCGASLQSRVFGFDRHALKASAPCPESRRVEQCVGGRGGIRTHGTLAGTPVFKTGALNHSATLPSLLDQALSRREIKNGL